LLGIFINKNIYFRKILTKRLGSYWELGGHGKNYNEYWKAIEILSPNHIISNHAIFNLHCQLPIIRFFYRISGNINGGSQGNLINMRKVRIILKKGGTTLGNQILTLNSSGRADYTFSGPFLTNGTYILRVEKVPTAAGNPNNLNVCFDGTTPSVRSVTLNSSHTRADNENFVINFSIAWDRSGYCW